MDGKDHIRFVGATVVPIFEMITENNKTRVGGYLKYTMDFLTKALNTSYEILVADEVGREVAPGNWTGCVGKLHRNEADVYISHFAAEPRLFDFVGFSNSFEDVTMSVMSGPPNTLTGKTTSLFSSVELSVWIGLIVCWILISFLYWMFIPLEASFLQVNIPRDSLVECLLIYYGLLFQRGFENLPFTQSLRLLASGWLIFVIVLSTDLGGTLSSKLAVTDSPERIDRIQDILKYPNIKPYVTKGFVVDNHILTAENDELQAVWRQIVKFNGHQPSKFFFEGTIMDEISRGEAVGIGFREPMLGSFVSNDCKKHIRPFYMAKQPFLALPTIFMFRKNLRPDYVEAINRMAIVHGATGFGLLDWYLANQYALPCFEMALLKEGHKALAVRDLKQIFDILMMGLGTSFIVLILENGVEFYHKMTHSAERR